MEGFSAIVAGRRPGEYLAMPDNGFGNKANSSDFLLRAYYVRPDFKTAKGGTGAVDVDREVGDFVQFRDPNNVIGFPIQRPDDRLLTGADVDPESLQRGKHGDLWMGDEFGPWILHFDETGVLLEPPFRVPAGLVGSTSVTGFLESPASPFLSSAADATVAGSRGFESMSMSPNGKYLYGLLEGATVQDSNKDRRYLVEFSIADRCLHRQRLAVPHAADRHRHPAVLLHGRHVRPSTSIGWSSSSGTTAEALPCRRAAATFSRGVYVIDLRHVGADGFLEKTRVIDLTAIPDPDLVSLPADPPR